jgi:hypothetical protein
MIKGVGCSSEVWIMVFGDVVMLLMLLLLLLLLLLVHCGRG